MTKQQRIAAFAELGERLAAPDSKLRNIMVQAVNRNAWYTLENVQNAVDAIRANLTIEQLTNWLLPYPDIQSDKTVGLVLAGNIPLVGFHDILSVLISGFRAKIKPSSDDANLTTTLVEMLLDIHPAFSDCVQIVERLADYDLIIATGSDNSARYFEYYFGKKPHIIRRNRNSIAVIRGDETPAELQQLGHDIFDYFGLGCRSVSKLLLPKDYHIADFFRAIEPFNTIAQHFKYRNNYDYNKSIYLLNGDQHFDNGFLLLKEDTRTASPLSVVYYEQYEDLAAVESYLNERKTYFQCVLSQEAIKTAVPTFRFGESQRPALNDYADGINTLDFLFANQ